MKRILILFLICSLFSFVHSFAADEPELVKLHDFRLDKINRGVFTPEEMAYIAKKKNVVMCIDPDWMPYEKIDVGNKYIGISADYHSLIHEITGLGYSILHTKSWSETLEAAQAGKCDILSILNQTEDREKYLNFTSGYIDSPSVFVTRDRDKFINGPADLHGKTLAVVKGYKIDELIRKNHPGIMRIHVPNINEALKMVSQGKAFSTAGSLLEMSYSIRQGGMLNLKITGDAKFGYILRVGVKKSDLLLQKIMDKAVNTISKEDRDNILNKWISIKYQKSYDNSLVIKVSLGFLVIILLIAGRFAITSRFNKKLLVLNEELVKAKSDLEKVNQNLEHKVNEETAKRLENERILMQQSKLAAMGDMLGAIAHQWRQPLSAVCMQVQDIEDANSCGELDDEYLKDRVDIVIKMIQQMSNTIDDFSSFFKPDKEKEIFNLNFSMLELTKMLKPQADRAGIEITVSSCGKSFQLEEIINMNPTDCIGVTAYGYQNEFKHILLNLIKNAMDAVNEKDAGYDKKIWIDIFKDDDHSYVSVKDNGGGIPENVQDRVFEPYFSTKEEGKGIGIGLYMSKLIVENMDGKLEFDNTDEGVCFKVTLDRLGRNI